MALICKIEKTYERLGIAKTLLSPHVEEIADPIADPILEDIKKKKLHQRQSRHVIQQASIVSHLHRRDMLIPQEGFLCVEVSETVWYFSDVLSSCSLFSDLLFSVSFFSSFCIYVYLRIYGFIYVSTYLSIYLCICFYLLLFPP